MSTAADIECFRIEALLDVLSTGVLFLDSSRRVVHVNESFRRMWGLPLDLPLTGVPDTQVTERTAWLREDDAAFREHLREVVRSDGVSLPFEIRLQNGVVLSERSRPIRDGQGNLQGRVWLFDDVTEQRQAQRRLRELVEYDALTGLYNRRRFDSELDRLIADAERRGSRIGLMVFNIDSFRQINEKYGYPAGDEVLVALVREVSATTRRNEQFFRIGGDEFALLVLDSSEIELAGLAKRILLHAESLAFGFAGDTVQISVSIGIAIYPEHALNVPGLLQCADRALFDVKAGGKHGWGFCDPAVMTRL